MAETDIELSIDLDVKDAEKTAGDLQKEIEKIFNSKKSEQSASLTNLELQMKKNYDTAEALRNKMIELGRDIPTAEYSKVLSDIEQVEQRIDSIGDQLYKQTRVPGFEDKVKALEFINNQLENYHAGTSGLYDVTGALGEKERFWTPEELQTYKIGLEGIVGDYNALLAEQDKLSDSLDSLNAKRAELEASHLDIIIGKETQEYQNAQTALDITNDKLKQQIIHYSEIDQKEQEAIAKEQQKLAIEQQLRQEAEERHKIQMQIAQKNWDNAVAEEERQAILQQQRQLELQEQQRIKEEAEQAAQAQREARMETIAANTSLMSLNMAIRSIGRIIPGVSTAAISGVIMLTRAVVRLTKLTKADLVLAIGKVKAAFASLFAFIMAHPIILVITAIIAAIVALIKLLKDMWDETEKQVDELFDKISEGLEKFTDLATNFIGTLTKGFIKLGDLLPTTLLKIVQGIVNKLKSLKSIIKENLDLMAQWNDGNNEVNTSLSNITSSLAYLKATLATAVAPILTYIEPILTHFIDILADILNMIGMVIAKMTGATTYQKAIRVQNDYADSLDKTANSAKKATGSLAGFDKLNVLNKNNASNPSAKSVDFSKIKLEDTLIPSWFQDFETLGKKLGGLLNNFLKNLNWSNIKKKAKGIGTDIAKFINGFFSIPDIGKTIGGTLAEGLNTITGLINSFIENLDGVSLGTQIGTALETMVTTIDWGGIGDLFSGSLNKLVEIVKNFALNFNGEDLGVGFTTMLQHALGNIKWDEIKVTVEEVVKDIAGFFNEVITPENFELVGTTLGELLNTIMTGINVFADKAKWTQWGESVADGIIKVFETTDFVFSAQAIGKLLIGILDGILAAVNKLTDPENLDKIINAIIDFFENVPWDEIKQKAKEISAKLRDGLAKIWEALKNSGAYDAIISFIVDFLQEKENWDKLFEGFKSDVVADIFWGKIKGVLTAVGEAIAGAFRKLFNFLSDGISNIASFFGDFVFGDSSFSDWLNGKTPTQLNAPHMNAPQLAQGAVLPPNKPFLAMVGDQKNGTNIEAPLDTIKQAVAEVLANMQIKNVFDVQGDSNRLFKVVQKESNIYYDQHGYSAFKG